MLRKIASLLVLSAVALLPAMAQQAQGENPLKPPKGYKVALVEFEDLECPDCANAAPLMQEAAKTYHIPLVRYDFPLPQHAWAKPAAIMARYFDTKSKKLGDEFRAYCFKHQPYPNEEAPYIQTPEDLRKAAEKFAAEHHVSLPLNVDPDGKLEAKVDADKQLGVDVGIKHTPTIYVVSDKKQGQPFVEVVDRTNLFSQIDQMIAEAGGTRDTTTKHAKAGGAGAK